MKAFYNPGEFSFIEKLRDNWRDIRAEYLHIQNNLIAWYESDIFTGDWKVFGLYDYPHGKPLYTSLRCPCPVTARLIGEVPGHGAGGFSLLRPDTHIRKHTGYQGPFLRCHLGLIVPEGDCAIRVGGDTRSWSEGEALVFDDRLEHEAWNRTGRDRVVLLVDFAP